MSDRDTDLRLDEYTYDLYAGTSRNFASGVSFSASLTGEYYRRNGYDRWAFFPQASLSWIASADHILQAEFSSDKSYPSFWDMSGAVTYLDGYAEVHGTPGLRPSSNYGLTLTYVLKQKYIFQLFGNHRVDAFTQSAYLSPDRPALIYQTLNWDYMSSFGALAVVPLRIGERFTSRITLSGFDYLLRNRDFYGMDYKRSKWVGYAALDNTLRLSRKPDLAFEFGGYYQSEAIQWHLRHRRFVAPRRRGEVDVRRRQGRAERQGQRPVRQHDARLGGRFRRTASAHGQRLPHAQRDGQLRLPLRRLQGQGAQEGRHLAIRALKKGWPKLFSRNNRIFATVRDL